MKKTLHTEYSVLAEIYDAVMDNVDYEVWADFIDEIIQVHHPAPQSVLEIACGTGSLSLALNRYGCYDIMGTDKSMAMIMKAREKAATQDASITFMAMDFLDLHLPHTFDIIVSIFDSINYLQSEKEIHQLLEQVQQVMNPQSLFIFDFTTPRNSLQAIKHLNNEEGITPNNYHYFRKSEYDQKQKIHYNIFDISKLSDDHSRVLQSFTEQHKQRAYSLTQMQEIIEQSDFNIVAQYSEFDLYKATSKSLRITMVLQCPDMP